MRELRRNGGYRFLAALGILTAILVVALILLSLGVPGMAYVAFGAVFALALLRFV